ncbi:UNVERIFIED_CONTAM: hypothetical protein Slati_0877800 [Sesamum latifolium]|uniref:Uncharacterized protein n=1 Tax=Sesamum latifolium TaxID=2727402 RepID=A0AAW2XRK8_9LAMI
MEIADMLPEITHMDSITWNSSIGEFGVRDAYRVFQPPGLRVHWYALLTGPSESFVTALFFGLPSLGDCPP